MISIANRRCSIERLKLEFPKAEIIDLTSKGVLPYVKFSPFFPIGDIPIPFSPSRYSQSVEGIWQGLKVFQNEGIDERKFFITSMKGLKRTVRKYGIPKGHQKGIHSSVLLDYITARKLIYLPTYKWVIENKLKVEIQLLKKKSSRKDLVLLDYETNGDINNAQKPLSHAYLVKYYLENQL